MAEYGHKTEEEVKAMKSEIMENVKQGCQTHFHQGPHQPHSCLQRAECNFNSLTVRGQLHLFSPKIILAL